MTSERVLPHLQSWANVFYLDEKQVEQFNSRCEARLEEPFSEFVIRSAIEQGHLDFANMFEDYERNWVITLFKVANTTEDFSIFHIQTTHTKEHSVFLSMSLILWRTETRSLPVF